MPYGRRLSYVALDGERTTEQEGTAGGLSVAGWYAFEDRPDPLSSLSLMKSPSFLSYISIWTQKRPAGRCLQVLTDYCNKAEGSFPSGLIRAME